VSSIHVQPVGPVDEEILDVICRTIDEAFGNSVVVRPRIAVPEGSFDEGRGQFSSSAFLRRLADGCPQDVLRMLGVTQCDLFIPMLSFVFGQAQLNGRVALLSVARLRQEFYGLTADRTVVVERTQKETLHELGHTFGLIHCLEKECPMSLSTTIQHLDQKGAAYCRSCSLLLDEALRGNDPGGKS
jgi:archaemetzincin